MRHLRYRWWVFSRVYHAFQILRGRQTPGRYYLPSIRLKSNAVIETRRGWLLIELEEDT
jgi:hypothetical protein